MPDYEKLFEDLEESIKNKDYAGQLQGTILFNSEAAARQKLAEGGNVFAPSMYSIDNIYNTILNKVAQDKLLNFLQTSGNDGGKYLGGLK